MLPLMALEDNPSLAFQLLVVQAFLGVWQRKSGLCSVFTWLSLCVSVFLLPCVFSSFFVSGWAGGSISDGEKRRWEGPEVNTLVCCSDSPWRTETHCLSFRNSAESWDQLWELLSTGELPPPRSHSLSRKAASNDQSQYPQGRIFAGYLKWVSLGQTEGVSRRESTAWPFSALMGTLIPPLVPSPCIFDDSTSESRPPIVHSVLARLPPLFLF